MINVKVNAEILLVVILAVLAGGCGGSGSGPAADANLDAEEIQARAAGMPADGLKTTVEAYQSSIDDRQKRMKALVEKGTSRMSKDITDLQREIRQLTLNLGIYADALTKKQ